ncbi:MAG: 2-amino-4-hydroxy-6-hydroxymethyldihydropteridine diphosphokinase [Chloroflexi bacterium]|nr:2-amino-4-hydroxy-6-hydroxymethyldihydropteridine diphosphokinase [Chloroflexota bacterium]
MSNLHQAYLSLGSNIDAEKNLPKAIELLGEVGKVAAVSSVWESESVGFDGPNFLNACVLFLTPLQPVELKEEIIRPIEAKLGRIRGSEKNAPRTIDIDIVLFDETPLNTEFWEYAFVIIPLAELIPDFVHPVGGEKLSRFAGQASVWIEKRADVVISAMAPRRD